LNCVFCVIAVKQGHAAAPYHGFASPALIVARLARRFQP
jgi:hypothetical protein